MNWSNRSRWYVKKINRDLITLINLSWSNHSRRSLKNMAKIESLLSIFEKDQKGVICLKKTYFSNVLTVFLPCQKIELLPSNFALRGLRFKTEGLISLVFLGICNFLRHCPFTVKFLQSITNDNLKNVVFFSHLQQRQLP